MIELDHSLLRKHLQLVDASILSLVSGMFSSGEDFSPYTMINIYVHGYMGVFFKQRVEIPVDTCFNSNDYSKVSKLIMASYNCDDGVLILASYIRKLYLAIVEKNICPFADGWIDHLNDMGLELVGEMIPFSDMETFINNAFIKEGLKPITKESNYSVQKYNISVTPPKIMTEDKYTSLLSYNPMRTNPGISPQQALDMLECKFIENGITIAWPRTLHSVSSEVLDDIMSNTITYSDGFEIVKRFINACVGKEHSNKLTVSELPEGYGFNVNGKQGLSKSEVDFLVNRITHVGLVS